MISNNFIPIPIIFQITINWIELTFEKWLFWNCGIAELRNCGLTCFACGAGHWGHDRSFDLFDDLFQIEELHGVAQEGRKTSSSAGAALPVVHFRKFVVNLPHERREIHRRQVVPLPLDAIRHRSNQLPLLRQSLIRIVAGIATFQPLDDDFPRLGVFRRLLSRSFRMLVRIVQRFLLPKVLGQSRRCR